MQGGSWCSRSTGGSCRAKAMQVVEVKRVLLVQMGRQVV